MTFWHVNLFQLTQPSYKYSFTRPTGLANYTFHALGAQDDRAAVLRAVRDRLERAQLRGVHDETGKSHGAQQPVGERGERGLVEGQSQLADRREGRGEHDAFLGGHRIQSGHRVGKYTAIACTM